MIILGEAPDRVTKNGVKSEDWFKPAKTRLMKEPKKFLSRLLEFAKKEKKNLSDKVI